MTFRINKSASWQKDHILRKVVIYFILHSSMIPFLQEHKISHFTKDVTLSRRCQFLLESMPQTL